jgi:perosamine synthetase
VAAIEGYVKPIYLYPMFSERVKARARGFGAGTWHPAEGTGVTYGPGLCPVTEAMHFQELLYTNILRADLGRPDALEFSTAIRRVYEHRHRVREELSRQGAV